MENKRSECYRKDKKLPCRWVTKTMDVEFNLLHKDTQLEAFRDIGRISES